MSSAIMLWLAEIVGPDLSAFEQRLQGQFHFIILLYGAVFIIGLCLLIAFTLRIQDKPLSWSGPLRRLEKRPWLWRDAALVVLPLLLIQMIAVLLFSFWGVDSEESKSEEVALILQSLVFHWVGFVMVAGSLFVRKQSWRAAFGGGSAGALRNAGWGVLILMGVMPLILGYNIVAQIVLDWLGRSPDVQDVTRIISESTGLTAKIYLALLALVIAPVVEELLFRGVLLPALSRLAGVKGAIVVVSILFAAVHGHWPSFVPLFILSSALCLAYIYRGTLVTSIVMHSCFNALTVAVILQM